MVCGNVFYVSEESSKCPPDTSCKSFDYYATNLDPALLSNSILYFLEGTYYLSHPVVILNVTNLTLQGLSNMEYGTDESVRQTNVEILCISEQVGIAFINCKDIKLANLTIKNCSRNYSIPLLNTTISSLIVYNTVNFMLEYMSIQDSPAVGIFFFTLNISISDSSFSNNGHSIANSSAIFIYFPGIALPLTDYWECHIVNTNITKNSYGITIRLQQSQYFLNMNFQSIFLANNSMSNVFIGNINARSTCLYNLTIDKLVSVGSRIGLAITQNSCLNTSSIPYITITNSVISNNTNFGIYIAWLNYVEGVLQINSSLFRNNNGTTGSALYIAQYKDIGVNANSESFKVYFYNLTFDSNSINKTVMQQVGLTPSFELTVALIFIRNLHINNCTFSNNRGSALFLYQSLATFYGINTFINNTGHNGGGMFLITDSFLLLQSDALISFINNHATNKGGAIHIAQIILQTTQSNLDDDINDSIFGYCFFQFLNNNDNKYFYFKNNTAAIAGSAVYGGASSLCTYYLNNTFDIASSDLFANITTFVNQTGYSVISSDAREVCFCDNSIPTCNRTSMIFQSIPGRSIIFSVAAVGEQDGITTGVVSVIDSRSLAPVYNQNLSAQCTNITYKIEANNRYERSINITVTLSEFQTNFQPIPKQITVELQPCPYGFQVSYDTHICECLTELSSAANLQCNNVNGTVTREGTTWLEYNIDENCTIVNNDCRSTYCNLSSVVLPLNESNRQCSSNRNGRLCGGCAQNFSLILGSNQCKQCDSNAYIVLIIPFALAGIALVVFLIALNFTVSIGTINGIIFYANIIKIYEQVVPLSDIPFIGQFIDWINLDLGIETCFYVGMNSCGKIGLQFIFPFYIWFLIFMIILASRWSSKVARAVGNNAVPVLATLLLLSYTKLLRTIILILSRSQISCNGKAKQYWFVDANIPYLSSCHLALFIIALLYLIVLVVPYTLFLLFFPLFEVCRSKWTVCTSLYIKLKPVFDAYAGPHNDLFRYWPGLLVVLRVVLALTVALFYEVSPPVSILVAIVTILILILSFGKIYKSQYIHILDIWYLLSLLVIIYLIQGVVDGGVYSYNDVKIGVSVVLCTSFLVFIGVIFYHIYQYFVLLKWMKKKWQIKKEGNLLMDSVAVDNVSIPGEKAMNFSSVEISDVFRPELREPLLESLPD